MQALTTLFPVFIMILLGFIARRKNWIQEEHAKGAKNLVFNILFPVMIFNVLFSSSLPGHSLSIIAYVTTAFIVCYGIGLLIRRWIGQEFEEVTPFLLTTCEGGNVALPLYLTMVGAQYASNTVMFDMAGTIICFILVPILVERKNASGLTPLTIAKKIITNSFIQAVAAGLLLNWAGVYQWLQSSAFLPLYTEVVNMITGPIIGIILFSIGYELTIEAKAILPLLKLLVVRIGLYLLIIAGFYVLFGSWMKNHEFMLAVWLYFMTPTGFALPMQLSPICKSSEQETFMSAYISLFMIVTLSVYVILVLFVA